MTAREIIMDGNEGYKFRDVIDNLTECQILDCMEEYAKQQQGYSEEEVLEFTQTMIMQYKFGNTNIEQMDLLKETLQLFKKK